MEYNRLEGFAYVDSQAGKEDWVSRRDAGEEE